MAIKKPAKLQMKVSEELIARLDKAPIPVKPKPSSIVAVVDIPLDMLVGHDDNPNEQDEATFDQVVQSIREDGFDEPILVTQIGSGENAGKFEIVSGHHRVKGARVLNMEAVPAIVKAGWSGTKVQVELVKRNMLRGNLNPEKFTALYNRIIKAGNDEALTKVQMGFTKEDAFKKIYKGIEKALPPSQKKKLAQAKENIKSVDGLSSVLNTIFKEHGADLDHGFVVFAFGGKQHHFIECDPQLDKMMKNLEAEVKDKGLFMADVMKHIVSNIDLTKVKPSGKVEERKATRDTK
jgi:hypothetical protein